MSSRTLQDEEERLRQKLKRKAEERKSIGNGNSHNITETAEPLPNSNGHPSPHSRNDASLEINTGSTDRLKENTAEANAKDKKGKRNRDEYDGPADTRESLKRTNHHHHPTTRPNRDLYEGGPPHPDHSVSDPFYDRRGWEENEMGPPPRTIGAIIMSHTMSDSYGRQPPPQYPPQGGRGGRGGGPYHDYPPRNRVEGGGPPFHRGGHFAGRYREDERPPFARGRDGPSRGGYYPPHSRMGDFQPAREPFPYDGGGGGGYRGGAPPPPHYANMPERRREGPSHNRGMEESQNRKPTNSRRPSISSSSDRSDDHSKDSHSSSSSNRSSAGSRSVSSSSSSSSSSRSSEYSSSSSASSHRDRKDTRRSSDQDSRRSKPHQTKNVRTNEQNTTIDSNIPKEKRTIFVSQLVMRVNEDDLYRFFRTECGCKVVDVILLRDKRTGRHKGCSYIELARLEDIPRAMEWNDKPPPFQRFPIAIKAPDLSFLTSDATAAYLVGLAEGNEKAVEALAESVLQPSSLMSSSNALNVYVGNIDRNVTQPQLQAIFSQFGDLEKVSLQVDLATGISKGFAFFGFRDPKVANLCIQVMSGQLIAGRPLRTGWANSKSDQSVVSTEFPPNVAQRIRMVDEVLVRLNGTGLNPIYGFDWTKVISSQGGGGDDDDDDDDDEVKSSLNGISSAAELAINAALGVSNTVKDVGKSICSLLDPSVIGNNDKPTSCILVHNMFDKDQESDAGWEDDLELEFAEECGRYGKLLKIRVMSKEVGGKIYALFETMEGALACAKCLAGRWFDKRQLRVEFVSEDTLQ